MPKAKKILAWYFTNGTVLRDGQPLVVGKTYRYEGDVKIRKSGYHASRKLFDALRYAPGTQLSCVECWGDLKEEEDKLVAKNLKVLWTLDVAMILHELACRVAEIALSKIKDADPRSFAAIEAKRKWMRGEITDDELDVAWSAAWDAARSAERSAERDAAWDAERSAERDAAWDAARSAERDAAWDAARSAAWDAAEYAAEYATQLEAMVEAMVNEAQESKE